MAFELRIVESKEDLRQAIITFNQEATQNPDRTRKILSQTWYWVWDAESNAFGPSKFVGYRGMNFERYEAANHRESIGAVFNGSVTHRAIEAILGPYDTDSQLKDLLKQWAESLAGVGLLDGVDEDKWKFVRLLSERRIPNLGFQVGKIYDRRREIHARFGGQAQGGISTPAGVPLIFLFTGESGEQYGYRDGWSNDDIFLYTGEGQVGDMEFVRGNRAVRDHVSEGKDLLLFQLLAKGKGYRYLGMFQCVSWEHRPGLDLNRQMRKVIVFHLVQPDVESETANADLETPSLSLEELRSSALQASVPQQTAVPKRVAACIISGVRR
jgi:hypothetical protein